MNGPATVLLLSLLLLLVGVPQRSAPRAADAAIEVDPRPAAELAPLVAELAPPPDRAFTVRIPAFEDPTGEIAESVAAELRSAGLEVRITRVQRGVLVSRLEIGRFGRDDARRLADAISMRFPVQAYVTLAR